MKNIVLAIDIGASYLRAALINKAGKVLEKIAKPTRKKGKNGQVLTAQILEIIFQLMPKSSDLKGIGIGSIGPLDYKKGRILKSPSLPFSSVPLVSALKKNFPSLKISLLNDCGAAVWGEKIWGAGKNLENLVYITISTGIGTGAVVNGRLLFGRDGNAAEMGHQIIEEKYNFLCSCGKGRGHWEGIASGRNIPRFFKAWLKRENLKANFRYQTAKEIFAAAKEKDKIALKFLQELGKINARAVSNIIVAYNPALITLGGAVALNNADLILMPLKKNIDRFLSPPKIKITGLGEDIVLLGAAASVFLPPPPPKTIQKTV